MLVASLVYTYTFCYGREFYTNESDIENNNVIYILRRKQIVKFEV